jgi:CHAT domain-containing protein
MRRILILALVVSHPSVAGAEPGPWAASLSKGIAYRQDGNLDLSIDALSKARVQASTPRERMLATGELGASFLQARRLEQAMVALRAAYLYFSGQDRAPYAIDLGNLALNQRLPKEARDYYEEALQLAGSDQNLRVTAGLNLARIAPEAQRLQQLTTLARDIERIDSPVLRSRYLLNLGHQAQGLGQPALALAFQSLDRARLLAASGPGSRVRVETLDAEAQLYESQGRNEDALTFNRDAIMAAETVHASAVGDLQINLEWRQGRLYKALGNGDLSLAAYERAVNRVEALRQDIPIEYEDGQSSFRSTLEPVYLGYVDGLLKASDARPPPVQTAYLRRALDTMELLKQSEMQDYLGDRCTVDGVKGGSKDNIAPATAILYPIVFDDRLELLVRAGETVTRFSTKVNAADVRTSAEAFARQLRNGSAFLTQSRKLYDWLIRPLDGFIKEHQITNLVVAPDGVLRIIAMGALNDGNQFAIEKLAITTVTGLTMTNTSAKDRGNGEFLLAGLSIPGPVVDKLSAAKVATAIGTNIEDAPQTGLAQNRSLRAINTPALTADAIAPVSPSERSSAMRKNLSLPGVAREISAIGTSVHGTVLLNEPFTVEGFKKSAETGGYSYIHVATHGVFGGSGNSSYIMAYDDLLTLDGLQALLSGEQFRKHPIELLTLSACETAEGDDRSPLGISGVAIKARAQSVLGTLWPVDDVAAQKVMSSFYRGLATEKLSKAEALRQAQIELLRNQETSHPFFWAPFLLIGNWL